MLKTKTNTLIFLNEIKEIEIINTSISNLYYSNILILTGSDNGAFIKNSSFNNINVTSFFISFSYSNFFIENSKIENIFSISDYLLTAFIAFFSFTNINVTNISSGLIKSDYSDAMINSSKFENNRNEFSPFKLNFLYFSQSNIENNINIINSNFTHISDAINGSVNYFIINFNIFYKNLRKIIF